MRVAKELGPGASDVACTDFETSCALAVAVPSASASREL